jgi:Leucine-rich repeat (LRR) protein
VNLAKLDKLDLSSNQLATLPEEIKNLTNLEELRLDSNMIASLPEAIGQLTKLKVLSLRDNKLQVTSTTFNDTTNPQPLPKSLFTDTRLIDLNLHGNRLTNTQMNLFEGYHDFLDRRQKVKSKTMTNFDVCGLD